MDTKTNKLIHTIQDVDEPHPMLFLPASGRLSVVAGGDGSIRIFSSKTYVFENFAVDRGQLEVPAIFSGELANDLHGPMEMRRTAGMAGGTDNHGNACLQTFADYDAKIALRAVAGTAGIPGTEVIRAGIRGAGIASDERRAIIDRADESFLSKPGAQIAGSRERFYFGPGDSWSVLPNSRRQNPQLPASAIFQLSVIAAPLKHGSAGPQSII